jgi:hypothetical protein
MFESLAPLAVETAVEPVEDTERPGGGFVWAEDPGQKRGLGIGMSFGLGVQHGGERAVCSAGAGEREGDGVGQRLRERRIPRLF